MKKVLMVAFEFPPLSSGGVMRCTKYVKYLRDYGWEPIVLTVAENAHPDALQDPRLLDELPPDITIHRTPYADFDALFQKELQNSALLKIYQSLDAGFPGLFGFAKPDKNITWFPAALEKASRIVSQERVDLIYTDSPPNSTALIGYKIKESFGIPWISGFRDPWSLDDLVYEDLKDRYHSRAREADALLENIILENCDRLIVVSEKLKEKYALPEFDKLNQEFRIEDIDDDTDIPLQKIRSKMTEKMEFFRDMMDKIIQPDANLKEMYEAKYVNDRSKETAYVLFKKLMQVVRYSNLVKINDSEKENAEFIKDSAAKYDRLKPQLQEHAQKLRSAWEKDTNIRSDLSYFG